MAPEQLSEERLNVIRYGTESRRALDEWFGERGVFLANCLEFQTFVEVKAATAAGIGIGFMSRYMVEEDIEAGRLQAVEIDGLHLVRPIFVVHRTQASGIVQALAGLIAQHASLRKDEPGLKLIHSSLGAP